MATPASVKLSQKMSAIAQLWHKDPFRPHLQLGVFLGSLAKHPRLTPQAVQAAQTLRDNRIKKRYQISEKTLNPASMPQHYDRLVEGFRKSAQGISRPWWKVFFGIW
ncbi:hypothetical protein K435DRAFT_829406 [Dendrothele bispora CBS 962.96]|uniref:Uncharacterized protein n=1 Tax=Dendrothele bispora (strain CBS 962.96) TaxID=1314807 RepID=A0A4S8LW55_DENBC|nr:hypothetical protein K435DRAFT_829406 [Dendrothele bispora CBS 962.96]